MNQMVRLCLLFTRKRSQELRLLIKRLEATVTKFGTGIDELEINLLEMLPTGMVHETLSKDERTLLDSDSGTLQHNPILVDLTVVWESTHGCDALLGKIGRGLTGSLIVLLSNPVDLLVELGSVEVTVLTGTCYGGTHTGRMPGTDTGDFSETTMGLTWETGDSPTSGDTLESVSLGNSNDIEVLVLSKDGIDSDLFFEEGLGEGDLSGGISSIDLDLHNVRLLDSKVELLDLGMGNDTHDGAEFGDTTELLINILGSISVLGSVLGKGLPLTLIPILITPSLILLTQMLRKDRGKIPQTRRSLHIPNHTHYHHRRDRKSVV